MSITLSLLLAGLIGAIIPCAIGLVCCLLWMGYISKPCPDPYSQEYYNELDLHKRCECHAHYEYVDCFRPER